MTLTVISVLVCLALTVKLVFFTDTHRCSSRWFYRTLLFLAAVYAGKQVIGFLYHPQQPTNPWLVLFHIGLFVGAFYVRPAHLPWNQTR